jgi:hypothetical protein
VTVAVRVQPRQGSQAASEEDVNIANTLRQTCRVYGPDSETLDVLYRDTVAPMVPAFVQGTDAIVLVYGTSTGGKTECLEVPYTPAAPLRLSSLDHVAHPTPCPGFAGHGHQRPRQPLAAGRAGAAHRRGHLRPPGAFARPALRPQRHLGR